MDRTLSFKHHFKSFADQLLDSYHVGSFLQGPAILSTDPSICLLSIAPLSGGAVHTSTRLISYQRNNANNLWLRAKYSE